MISHNVPLLKLMTLNGQCAFYYIIHVFSIQHTNLNEDAHCLKQKRTDDLMTFSESI